MHKYYMNTNVVHVLRKTKLPSKCQETKAFFCNWIYPCRPKSKPFANFRERASRATFYISSSSRAWQTIVIHIKLFAKYFLHFYDHFCLIY